MNMSIYSKPRKDRVIILAILGVLFAAVVVASFFSRSTITKGRDDGEYKVVDSVYAVTVRDGDEIRNECRFFLDEIGHAETLAFFVNHHNVEVYVGNELVYTFTGEDDIFSTSGGAWVTVPIYESDLGKEVLVILTPLYDNYNVKMPDFLLGSEVAVHNAVLHRALSAIMLSMCVIFAGLLLICLAIYNSIKGMRVDRLYALGIMALSAGVWRITYDRVAYLLFENNSVFIFTLSVVSLMALALSMLNSLEKNERNKNFVEICSYIYATVYVFQLVLQLTGIADLRQTLKVIHITIIVSAAAFVVDGLSKIFFPKEEGKRKINFVWLLGVGVALDLSLYYFSDDSLSLVFTLIAILIYSVFEGITLMFTYIEQKNAYEEMKIQLALSRTTTMMSQIRSHFVFNLLNAISGMCKYDPEMADDTVVRFARYLRNNIDIMEKDDNIPFETDLRQVEDYVALEQVRFGDKIEFYTDVEKDDFMIPPLILQPVVENAIKHGISKKQGNGTIILRTRDAGENVVITVEDDGVGFDMSELDKERSVGIRNIKFRLQHLVKGSLDIKSEVGVGTTVTITIPKE